MKAILCNALLVLFAANFFAQLAYAATIIVDVETDGSGGAQDCELQDAINAANSDSVVDGCTAGNGTDRIEFAPGIDGILLNGALPPVTAELEIQGPGMDLLTIDGDDNFQIFVVFGLANRFIVRDLTMFQGFSTFGGGCMYAAGLDIVILDNVRVDTCFSETTGGGINIYSEEANSRAVLRGLFFTGNTALEDAGGAGIYTEFASISDSFFLGNSATNSNASGGGITFGRSVSATITRTTFWGNQAVISGAAISANNPNVEYTIEHSTISQNTVTGGDSVSPGGAVRVNGTATIFNTVVADNSEQNPTHDRPDISVEAGSVLNTSGYNFVGSNEGSAAIFPAGIQANGDQAGTAVAPIDPDLGSVQDNGGSTWTAMPNGTSPLLDQGSCPSEYRDQRGFGNPATNLRPVPNGGISPADDGCDKGAAERLAAPIDIIFIEGYENL